jgi:hypothetical protein
MPSVLQHVAALTERAQIGHLVIGRIAVEVCRREHDARHPEPRCFHEIGPSRRPSAAVPPRCRLLIEPASVRQAAHKGQMTPTTTFASTSSTCEPYMSTEVAPVRRVQRSQLSAYGHGYVVAVLSPALWMPTSWGRSKRTPPLMAIRAPVPAGQGRGLRLVRRLDPVLVSSQEVRISPNKSGFVSRVPALARQLL